MRHPAPKSEKRGARARKAGFIEKNESSTLVRFAEPVGEKIHIQRVTLPDLQKRRRQEQAPRDVALHRGVRRREVAVRDGVLQQRAACASSVRDAHVRAVPPARSKLSVVLRVSA